MTMKIIKLLATAVVVEGGGNENGGDDGSISDVKVVV